MQFGISYSVLGFSKIMRQILVSPQDLLAEVHAPCIYQTSILPRNAIISIFWIYTEISDRLQAKKVFRYSDHR